MRERKESAKTEEGCESDCHFGLWRCKRSNSVSHRLDSPFQIPCAASPSHGSRQVRARGGKRAL